VISQESITFKRSAILFILSYRLVKELIASQLPNRYYCLFFP